MNIQSINQKNKNQNFGASIIKAKDAEAFGRRAVEKFIPLPYRDMRDLGGLYSWTPKINEIVGNDIVILNQKESDKFTLLRDYTQKRIGDKLGDYHRILFGEETDDIMKRTGMLKYIKNLIQDAKVIPRRKIAASLKRAEKLEIRKQKYQARKDKQIERVQINLVK